MSERPSSHEPANPQMRRVLLRNGEQILIPMNGGIREEWLVGETIVVIELPPEVGGKAKRIAIVDYGEDFEGKPLVHEAPGLGRAQTRYGLRGINYVPETHMMAYAPLPQGEEIILGKEHRVDGMQGYMLGLTSQDPGNGSLSGMQLSLVHDGVAITVSDLSRHGTIVEYLA